MLENSLLKTNYLGRDGYIWWIGQIVKQDNWITNIAARPTESNDEFKGFDYRYKVRILGYHPSDPKELADDQLPWASVLFPVTAGSGQGGSSQSPNLKQGMFVQGFFLDGEDGQQPVITGVFGVNQYAKVKRNMGPLGLEIFSGTKSTDEVVANYQFPVNKDQANTDGVVEESVNLLDQSKSGADLQSEKDDAEEQRIVKTTTCDQGRD